MQAGRIELTDEQRKAVEHFRGPMLVVAGPGAGKTRIIVERVAHLIEERGVEAGEMVVITFTTKAADELRERIIRRLGAVAGEMQISTIHSFCNRILRMYPDHHPMGSNFQVLDEEKQLMFIYDHRHELKLGHIQRERFPELQVFFSECQENMIEPETLINHYKHDKKNKKIAEAYRNYLELMDKLRVTGFAGMQWRAVKLLETSQEALSNLRSRYRFLMVDEYQDTNPIQEKLIELIAGEEKNIFAVGDEDQSIYGFRGSTPENFLNFQEKYGAEVVFLQQNFRSVPSIVDVTQRFMDRHRKYPKTITPVRKSRNRVFILDNQTHQDEPGNIASIIEDLVEYGVIPHRGYVTLLFRSVKYDATEIMNELARRGIPFNIWGEGGFFDREEIQYIIHLLQYTRSGGRKLINRVKTEHFEGEFMEISQESMEIIQEMGEKKLRELREHSQFREWGFKNREDIEKLLALNRLIDTDLGVLERYYEILEISQYPLRLLREGTETAKEKLYNLARFSSIIKDYERVSSEPTVEGLMEFLKMAMAKHVKKYDQILLENPYSVNIMTMHRAKGLEFPVVIICSVFNGKIPLQKDNHGGLRVPEELKKHDADTGTLEERRLFYVGMTRAMDILIISTTKNHRGREGYSPFIEELLNVSRIMSHNLGRIDPETSRIEVIENHCQVEDIETTETIKMSFTELNTYISCPFRYMLLYEYGFDVPSDQNQLYGMAVHECLRRINRRLMNGYDITDEYIHEIASEALRDLDINREAFMKFKSKLKRYISEIKSRGVRIVSAEKPFSIMKDGILITGQTDLIVENDGGLEIVDFKSRESSGIESTALELQLGVYRHALDMDFKDFWAYTFEDSAWRRIKPEPDVRSIIARVAEGIRRGEFPPQENDFCRWCRFHWLCESAGDEFQF
ncbi:ATP-dependent DNA helicase PcrA [Methanothermobacter wolfeii]|uniref:ATP-dependent helicase n=1 Tax=Methanothermobacter wolfeii TaxID=145261 RepID=UPI00092D9770|nr:ATP-dependent DNA helicase PcrA [Methanothermobacter wolfeii]